MGSPHDNFVVVRGKHIDISLFLTKVYFIRIRRNKNICDSQKL